MRFFCFINNICTTLEFCEIKTTNPIYQVNNISQLIVNIQIVYESWYIKK